MRRTQSESPSEVTPWSETKQAPLLGPEPGLWSQATPETPHPSMPEPEPELRSQATLETPTASGASGKVAPGAPGPPRNAEPERCRRRHVEQRPGQSQVTVVMEPEMETSPVPKMIQC